MKLAKVRLVVNFLFCLTLLFPILSEAADLTIFDTRRAVALSDTQKTYRDFYINGGIEMGINQGMILTVNRRLTLYDSYRANSPSELMVEVGRVKIIHVQKGLSVARHYANFSRKSRAIVEHDYIMVGDKIDLSSALMESQLKKRKKSADAKPSEAIMKAVAKVASRVYGPELPPESADLASKARAKAEPTPVNTLQ